MSSRLQKLKEIVAKKPEDAFALYALAMEHRALGELEAAEETFRRLLERNPKYVPAYYHFGLTLMDLGKAEAAREIWKEGMAVAEGAGDGHAREELEGILRQLHEGAL